MHYRVATEHDIDRVVELIDFHGRSGIRPDLRPKVPRVLRQLLAGDSRYQGQGVVFEEHATSPLAAFGLGVFVHDAFMDALLSNPQPNYANAFYGAVAQGHTPMLDRAQIAAANGRGDLNMVVLHFVERHHEVMHPANAELRRLGADSFSLVFAGFGLRRYLYETYGEESHRHLGTTGMRRIVDFSDWPEVRRRPPDHWPAWSMIQRGEVAADGPFFAPFFTRPQPRLGLTPRQQSVVLAAIQGQTDKQIALAHGVSLSAIRQSWEGVFNRCAAVMPGPGTSASGRGPERRRSVLDYLAVHMQELRPYKRPG